MAVKVLIYLTVYILAASYTSSAYAYFTQTQTEHIYTDDGDGGPLSNLCLNCMCEVLGCPHQLTCSDACGPFQITYSYWQAAFNRTHIQNEEEEFRKCTLNAWCAKRTVQKYMRHNLPICMDMASQFTNRSVSACETAMILHRYGTTKCNDTQAVSPVYREKLVSCLDQRTWDTLPSHSNRV